MSQRAKQNQWYQPLKTFDAINLTKVVAQHGYGFEGRRASALDILGSLTGDEAKNAAQGLCRLLNCQLGRSIDRQICRALVRLKNHLGELKEKLVLPTLARHLPYIDIHSAWLIKTTPGVFARAVRLLTTDDINWDIEGRRWKPHD